ncbi:hypothetical protein [Pseudodesulfovibrio sp.]|uniref:hypothetical protein n=1 Tax=Pseudodesulfovibrio sp. TaxID=2035812 RepID=UPI00260A60F2|nr:hypothetical protein [Pseudodesulfovibrio sp.]MDD3310549.1 hypothetical protein [Pseudodesulfovibrio sp.]
MKMRHLATDPGYLRLCDACCDLSGTAKEMVKTGGCTCDICGFSCKCCGDDGKQFVNRIPVRVIPDDGWPELQRRNAKSLLPLDWQALFTLGRADEIPAK